MFIIVWFIVRMRPWKNQPWKNSSLRAVNDYRHFISIHPSVRNTPVHLKGIVQRKWTRVESYINREASFEETVAWAFFLIFLHLRHLFRIYIFNYATFSMLEDYVKIFFQICVNFTFDRINSLGDWYYNVLYIGNRRTKFNFDFFSKHSERMHSAYSTLSQPILHHNKTWNPFLL